MTPTATRASASPSFQAAAGYDGPSWAPPRPTAPKPERPSASTATAAVRTLTRALRLWSLLPVAGLVAAAGLAFHRVFGYGPLVPILLIAVLVPTALSAGLSGLLSRGGRTAPLWPSLVLTVVAWLLAACGTLFREAGSGLPTGAAVRAVWSALLDSPHAILTTILPVPSEPELLVLPHAVLWLAAFTAAELALRTRTALLPAVPAVLAFGFPLVLGVDGPGSNTPFAAALVALAGLLVLLRSPAAALGSAGRGAELLRGLAVGLPVVAALALVAGLLGPHLPGLSSREPLDLRRAVHPPTARPESTSPLDQIAAWMQRPETELFKVEAGEEHNWRLAVLDRYNGAKWTSGAELARSGGRVPDEESANPGRRERIEQKITVQSLPGIWLPAADRPSSVRTPADTQISVDPASGVLATGERRNIGLTYTATSLVPDYDVERLQYASTADGQAYKTLPQTDAAGQPIAALRTFQELAATATAGSSYPYQQAVKLADWLREHYQFDPNAIPGHTYRNLEFFLTDGKRGTSEQFAASFAVLGRTLGLPTRVAVGFRAGTEAGGVWQVTGRDALAWPEVEFKGIGWVPFYPTPGKASKEGSSVAPAGQPKERKKVDQEIAQKPRPSLPPKPAGDASDGGQGQAAGGLPAWAYAPIAVLVLVTAYCLYAFWVPYRRRSRRRNAPDAGSRVLGAWEQIVERLTEIGLPPTSAHTATEVAAFGSRRVGGAAGEHLPELARLVNEVGYAGRKPDGRSADAAWLHCDAIEKVVVRSVTRRTRLRRALHPRALRPRVLRPRALRPR